MDLYELLPSVIRTQDRLGSGVGSTTQETILQKLFYALSEVVGTTEQITEGLSDLYNSVTCDAQYLPLLQYMLGSTWPGEWPESRRRQVVSSLVKLYHHSGQRLSWTSVLNLLGYSGFFPWELWKQDVFEDFDYFLEGGADGYYGIFHAARVDIRNSSQTLKTLTGAERELIEHFRPIHVLIRTDGDPIPVGDDLVTESLQVNFLGDANGIFEEQLDSVSDVLAVTIACVALCEIGIEPV